jgi:hypothetical protein
MDNIVKYARSVLVTTAVRWQDLTENVPIDLLTRPAAEGEWSAVECLQHLLDTEQNVFPPRLLALLEGRDFAAFNPKTQGSKPSNNPAQMAAEFAKLRNESLASLMLVKSSDLTKQARHSELGLVSMSDFLHEWAGHDLMHTVQAERALLQPFIQGCGAWRGYFADHDVEKK